DVRLGIVCQIGRGHIDHDGPVVERAEPSRDGSGGRSGDVQDVSGCRGVGHAPYLYARDGPEKTHEPYALYLSHGRAGSPLECRALAAAIKFQLQVAYGRLEFDADRMRLLADISSLKTEVVGVWWNIVTVGWGAPGAVDR